MTLTSPMLDEELEKLRDSVRSLTEIINKFNPDLLHELNWRLSIVEKFMDKTIDNFNPSQSTTSISIIDCYKKINDLKTTIDLLSAQFPIIYQKIGSYEKMTLAAYNIAAEDHEKRLDELDGFMSGLLRDKSVIYIIDNIKGRPFIIQNGKKSLWDKLKIMWYLR